MIFQNGSSLYSHQMPHLLVSDWCFHLWLFWLDKGGNFHIDTIYISLVTTAQYEYFFILGIWILSADIIKANLHIFCPISIAFPDIFWLSYSNSF
jgi:hypothetical protein